MKRMKTNIRQHDLSDCAAACVASIARHYGEAVPLTVIREASGTSGAGTSLKGILDACRAIGFQAAAYKSDDKQVEVLSGLSEPVILHVLDPHENLHFVVLQSVGTRNARVMDPAVGKVVRMPLEKLRKQWTGYLVTLQPAPAGKKPQALTSPTHHHLFYNLRFLSFRDFSLMLAGSIV